MLEDSLLAAAPSACAVPFLVEAAGLQTLLTDRIEAGTAAAVFAVDLLRRMSGKHDRPLPASLVEALTEREQVVLRYLASTLSNIEIAAELDLSVNTAETHQRMVYRKLGADGRRDAVRRAGSSGSSDKGIGPRVSARSVHEPDLGQVYRGDALISGPPLHGRSQPQRQLDSHLGKPVKTRLCEHGGHDDAGRCRSAIEIMVIRENGFHRFVGPQARGKVDRLALVGSGRSSLTAVFLRGRSVGVQSGACRPARRAVPR